MHLFHYHLVTSRAARRRGALPRQARLRPRRALRPDRRRARRGRAGRLVGAARPRRVQAAPVASSSAAPSTSSSSRATGGCRASTTSGSRSTRTSSRVLARAAQWNLRVQEHGGRRTFVATNAGYRLEVHPPRDWIDDLLAEQRRAPPARAAAAGRRAGREGGRARATPRPRGRDGDAVQVGETVVRFLPGGPEGRPELVGERFAVSAPERAVDCPASVMLLGASTATPPPVSRSRPPTRSSSGCAPPSSRPARPASARSRACTRSTTSRFLAASTDGVGTKLMLARARGRLRDCGADLAAHCINDVATLRRRPADAARLRRRRTRSSSTRSPSSSRAPPRSAAPRASRSSAARRPSCPASTREGELDFAGTCVGIVDRADLIDGSTIEAGDVVIGFAVGGRARERLHARPPRARGRGLRRRRPARADAALPRRRARAARPREGVRARDRRRHRSATSSACSPTGARVELDWDAWERPPVFDWLARHVDEDELRRVFNLGIGWCAVVAEPAAGRDRDRADRVIGVLVSGNGTNLQALLDAGLPIAAVAVEPHATPTRSMRAREAGIPTATFSLDCHADRDERDLVMATWLEEHGVELVVLAGYMHLLTKPFLDRFPERDRQRPPVAAAGVPRRARDRRRARRGRRDDRRHRPLRRRGRSTPAPCIAPGGGAGRAARDARGAHPRGRAPAAARRSSQATLVPA